MVLNWNGWSEALRCLDSIRDSADADDVWLIDNGSSEDRSAEVREAHPAVRIHRWDENLGYSGGYNRALRLAVREGFAFACLLNNDTIVKPRFLSPLVEAAQADTRLAIVGSWLVYMEDDARWVEFDGEHHPRRHRPFRSRSGVEYVPSVIGAAMLIRLDALERDGYFDERFFCYGEEAELCARLTAHGWLVAVCADSVVLHERGGSDVRHNQKYYLIRNQFLMLQCQPAPGRSREAAVYQAVVSAEDARHAGRMGEWAAIASALDDGMRGEFGPRGRSRPTVSAMARLVALTVAAHLADKWRALRGRPPGPR